jgi:hypothetical protein
MPLDDPDHIQQMVEKYKRKDFKIVSQTGRGLTPENFIQAAIADNSYAIVVLEEYTQDEYNSFRKVYGGGVSALEPEPADLEERNGSKRIGYNHELDNMESGIIRSAVKAGTKRRHNSISERD